jgi:hypothetical protein
MFEQPAEDDDDEHGIHREKFQAYPQAGLVSCGHVVAQGLMYPIAGYVAKLNDWLGQNREDDQDEEERIRNDKPVIVGISSQMYNSMMHHTRGNSTQQPGIVLGNVTATLAGYWTRSTPHATKAADFA